MIVLPLNWNWVKAALSVPFPYCLARIILPFPKRSDATFPGTVPVLMGNLSMTASTVMTVPAPSDMSVPDVLLPKDYAGPAANVWKPAILIKSLSAQNFPDLLMSVMPARTVPNVPWKRLFIMPLMPRNNTNS